MTLNEDFSIWWNMAKYQKATIPAKEFRDIEITVKHGSNTGWPGPERDVHYWVELANNWAVGIITPELNMGNATFPMRMLK